MRSLFWSHISGLHPPLIPPGLMQQAMRFVFTTPASLDIAPLRGLAAGAQKKFAVINSGFGCAGEAPPAGGGKPVIAYLGTVDFLKMHAGFFDAVDLLTGAGIRVAVWGEVDAAGAVAARARAMRHPRRIEFRGQTAEPARALAEAEIFFYPLRADHYGTAENALIEAMSLGLVSVVLDNAAERAIVRHGETGFIAQSIEEAAALLQTLLASPDVRQRVSHNAMAEIAATRRPELAAHDFMILWLGLLSRAPRRCDFRAAVGASPADWFVATQGLATAPAAFSAWEAAARHSKGTLAHFESVFAGDASLARLRRSL